MIIAAVFFDIRIRKIPNWLIAVGMGIFLIADITMNRLSEGLECMAIAFVISFLCYLVGAVGAGDAKLYMIVGLVEDMSHMAYFGILSMFFTIIYGLIIRISNKNKGFTKVPMAPGMLCGYVTMIMMGVGV